MRRLLLIVILLCVAAVYSRGEDEERDPIAMARVRAVVSALNEAIEREDVGGYMLQIDVSEPTFAAEQRAWIIDAMDQGYDQLRYDFLGGLGPGAFQKSETEIWAGIGVRWSGRTDGMPWDQVYIARFVRQNPESDVWTFSGPGWFHDLVDEDTNIRVLAGEHQEELAERVLTLAPEIVQRTEIEMGLELHQTLVIKIYAEMNELQSSISPAYKDPLSGWNEPGESIKILSRDSISDSRLSALLAHEIGHAVSFEFGEHINEAPWWSLEGIAELASDPYKNVTPEEREIGVAKQVARGDRRTWNQLSDFKGEALNHSAYVYTHGWSMIRFITNRFGAGVRNEWFAAMGEGQSIDDASRAVLGISLEDLDRAWEAEMLGIAESGSVQP